MTQRDAYGEGGGRGVQDWELMKTVADSCKCMAKPIQYCKVKKIKNKEHTHTHKVMSQNKR